jgi:hypothetical protein
MTVTDNKELINKIKDAVSCRLSIPPSDREELVFAGNSRFTLVSTKTRQRYTFKVVKHKSKDIWFVNFLAGSNNETDYIYLGYINEDFEYRITKKSAKNQQVQTVFKWFFNCMESPLVDFYHEGRCCACGRLLTTPESIKSGLGPICSKRRKGDA